MRLEELVIPLKIEDGIKAGLATAGAAITAFVGLATLAVNATMKWADELDGIQDIMGVTAKEAAALNFVLRKSGTETSKLTKGMTILEKGLVKANGELDIAGKALKEFGINIFDANGNMKDQSDLLEEIGSKYNSFSTQQERVNFLTEVFGKSGADLIDFFDTMAREGGIDKVTEKVEKFGLAIDPDRYEQFNRNLEELKLIGLGLAVAFTEKVLPVFETLLEWVMDFMTADTPTKMRMIEDALKSVDEVFAAWVDGITDWFSNPSNLANAINSITDWISGIGTGDEVGTASVTAVKNLIQAITNAFNSPEVQAALEELKTIVNEKLAGAFEEMGLSKENAQALADLTPAIIGLTLAFQLLSGPLTIAGGLLKWIWGLILGIPTALAILKLSAEIVFPAIGYLVVMLVAAITGGAVVIQATFFGIAVSATTMLGIIGAIFVAIVGIIWFVIANWETLSTTVSQLSFIMGWAIKQAFDWMTNTIDDSVGWMTDRLNDLVDWIKDAVNWLSTLGGLIGNTNTSMSSGGTTNRRASGGPVIAGQSYNVVEFGRPEVFTPNVSGRIDPADSNKSITILDIDYARLARVLSVELDKVMN